MELPTLPTVRAALLGLGFIVVLGSRAAAAPTSGPAVSAATKECLGCHEDATPGIVADWRRSRHARTSVAQALRQPAQVRRISIGAVPARLGDVVVGCAECHTQNPGTHRDSFAHGDHRVHVVVTPADCATCHPTERAEYERNLMAHAYGNLKRNPLYHALQEEVNGVLRFAGGGLTLTPADAHTQASSCFSCHGTQVEVQGRVKRSTDFGDFEFPILAGWPNQGVGSINPDGTRGACTSCHARHQFSLELARKANTCAECHKGPDVPAYNVYGVSKHGAIYESLGRGWDFAAVPWVPGKHFTTPTCAGCHVSGLASESGKPIVARTHQMSDRLPYRLFGLPYAHAHPRSPDTTGIVNQAGLPLPTELTGEPVARYLIDDQEQGRRRARMQTVCRTCHSSAWTEGHFARLETAIKTTNAQTLAATQIVQRAWVIGAARGPAQKSSPFDELIERRWVEQWLFFANSTRFAAAMSGADYGVFEKGRWEMSKNLRAMHEWLQQAEKARGRRAGHGRR
jgi:hydroxylamine dehydrogenase